jgi:AAA domain
MPWDPPPAIVRWVQPSQQERQDERAEQTISLLGTIFTPGAPIDRPDLFSGRRELLKTIRETFSTTGQNLVIYGHRGLGKTSLVLVAFHQQSLKRHTCSKDSTFRSIFLDILTELKAQCSTVERSAKEGDAIELGVKEVARLSTKDERSEKESVVAKQTLDPNFVAKKLGHFQQELKAIIIDEFQEVRDSEDQRAVIDTAKILSDQGVRIPIVIIGHAASDSELFAVPAYHEYVGRYFNAIEVKEMPDSELADIIARREKMFGARFTPHAREAIIRIAAGYPTVVHRLALDASIERANAHRVVEIGWKDVFGIRRSGTFLDDLTWLVTQADTYGAVLKFVAKERDKHQGEFIALIEFFLADVSGRSVAGQHGVPPVSIPTPALRGAGYSAKFYLATHPDRKPDYLYFPNTDAALETEVLQLWASHFFEHDLNLPTEASLLPIPNVQGSSVIEKIYLFDVPDDPQHPAQTGKAPTTLLINGNAWGGVKNEGVPEKANWVRGFLPKRRVVQLQRKKPDSQEPE